MTIRRRGREIAHGERARSRGPRVVWCGCWLCGLACWLSAPAPERQAHRTDRPMETHAEQVEAQSVVMLDATEVEDVSEGFAVTDPDEEVQEVEDAPEAAVMLAHFAQQQVRLPDSAASMETREPAPELGDGWSASKSNERATRSTGTSPTFHLMVIAFSRGQQR